MAKRLLKALALTLFSLFPALIALGSDWADDRARCLKHMKSRNEEGLDLNSRFAIEYAILDNMELHLPWLKAKLQSLDPHRESFLWMRAAWALALVGHLSPEDAERGKKLALEGEHYLEYAGFVESLSDSLANVNSNPSERLAEFKLRLEGIRKLDSPLALAYTLSAMSLVLVRQRMIEEALPMIREAMLLNEKQGLDSPLIDYWSKIALGVTFLNRKMQQEELDINLANSHNLRQCGIRSSLGIIAYARANLLMQKEPYDWLAIDQAIDEAYSLSIETNSKMVIALSLYARAGAFNLKKQHAEALVPLGEALATFEREKMSNWVAKAKHRQAQIYFDWQKFDTALRIAQQARGLFSVDNKEAINEIDWILYRSLKEMGRKDEALQKLDEYVSNFKELAKKREKDEFNKAAASIGLQREQERSENLRKELSLKADLLEEADKVKRFTIGLALSLAFFIGLFIYAIRQTRAAHKRREQVTLILENIDEGLLTLDASLRIGADYSAHLPKLLETNEELKSQEFFAILQSLHLLGPEQKSIIENILSVCFQEESLAWEFNAVNLPEELQREQPYLCLQIRWIPIFNQDQQLKRLLVSLRDVSKERELERTARAQDRTLKMLPQTLRELVQQHGLQVHRFLQDLRQSMQNGWQELTDLKLLHTYKGIARSFQFRELSGHIHELESAIQTQASDRIEAFHRLEETLKTYEDFAAILKDDQHYENWLGRLLQAPIENLLRRAREESLTIESITIIEHPKVTREVHPELLQSFFIHGLNNAFDHGFLRPKRQGKQVKPIKLILETSWHENRLRLRLADNGNGIPHDLLREKARRQGINLAEHDDVSAFLFGGKLSSADAVSETSGRGVGLAAVFETTKRLGGQLQLLDGANQVGTELLAEVPRMEDSSQAS